MSDLSVPVDDSSPEFHNALSRLAKDGLKSSGTSTVVHDWDSILPQLEASCVDLDQLTDTGSVYTPEESSPLNHIRCSGITQNANYEGQIFGIDTCDNLHSARPTSQTRFIESEGIRTPWTDCTSPDPTDFITTDRTRQKLVRSSATQRGNTAYYSEQPNKFRGSVRRTSHIHGSPNFQEKLIPPCPLTDFTESRNTSHSLEDDLWTVGSELGIFVGGVKGQGSDGATAVLPRTAHNTDHACYPNEYRSEIPIKQKYSIQSEGSFDFHGCTSQHTRRSFPKSALERLTSPRQCIPVGKNNNLSSAETVPLQRPVSAKLKAVRWALKSPEQHKRHFETGVTSSPQSKRERNAHVKETEDCWCIVYPQEESVNRETFWPVHQGAKLGSYKYGEFVNASRPVAKPSDLHFSLKNPIPIKNISQKDNLVRPASWIKRARQKTTTKERRLNAQMNRQQTETLIEAIEALRDSISLSNRQLELHLKKAQPLEVSKVKHRMHGSLLEIMPHRASSNSNRTSRTRGFKHDFSKRTGAFRRSEEGSQTRDEKVTVEVRVVFLKIGEIDTLKELYYADAFIQAKWREPKLDGRITEDLTINELEQYWNPLLFIDNILSETKETQWLMAQRNETGEVYLLERRRIKGVFLETLELNDFPLDVQDLTITVTSERPESEVDIIPDQNEMSAINVQTFVDQQEWKLHEHVEITKRIMKQEYSSSMKSHACLSVTCRAARRPGYFYWNVFLIMFMISSLSFATFAVSPDKAELRLRLSFTLILTSVTFKYVITQSLPKISYLTYMDKYVLMSLAILCIISVWHAIVTLLDPEHIATKYSKPANLFDLYGLQPHKSFLPSDIAVKPANNTQNETDNFLKEHAPLDNGFADNLLAFFLGSEQIEEADQSAESKTSTDNGNISTSVGDQQNTTVPRLSNECSLDNKMACEEWKRVQIVEQHVFTSFVIIYVIAHAVFIFWLYFDASRRRREMRQKDKDYRDFLRRHQQWQQQSLRQRDLHAILRSSLHT